MFYIIIYISGCIVKHFVICICEKCQINTFNLPTNWVWLKKQPPIYPLKAQNKENISIMQTDTQFSADFIHI